VKEHVKVMADSEVWTCAFAHCNTCKEGDGYKGERCLGCPHARRASCSEAILASQAVGGQIIDVNVYGNRVRGSGLTASWEETPTGLKIYGQVNGRLVEFEVSDTNVRIRSDSGGSPVGNADGFASTVSGPYGPVDTSGLRSSRPPTSYTLRRLTLDTFQAGFTFGGKAAEVHPPEPQFLLMMIGAFD
jgi:hypothetical protein